jgi:hypothetical protein
MGGFLQECKYPLRMLQAHAGAASSAWPVQTMPATSAGLRIRAIYLAVRCHQALTLEAENRLIQTNHPG